MADLGFSYDKNSPHSWMKHFVNLLDDLKHDRLTDNDIAKAFADFNLGDADFKELMDLFGSAHLKMEKIVWVDKKTMAESLGISEKTLERFKADHKDKLEINVTHKKLDRKTERYHVRNFSDLYHDMKDQESWAKIVSGSAGESDKPNSTRKKRKE